MLCSFLSRPIACLAATLLLPIAAPSAPPAHWQLLSGNAGHPQAIDLGLTYSYDIPPNNPADEGHRLLDGDAPADDWNNVVGFNGGDRRVEFRWPQPQRLARIRLRMADAHRPLKVEVSGRLDVSGPWKPLGEIVPARQEQGTGWYELNLAPTKLREVRLDLRLKEWGFYLHEVQLWGVPGYVYPDPITPKMSGSKSILAQGGVPHAKIVLARDASEKARAAATLLQSVLYRMTGTGLPIVTEDASPTGTLLLVGPGKLIRTPVAERAFPTPERSIVRRDGSRIELAGNDAGAYEGTRRAVYLFLQSLGCGWYAPSPTWIVVPKVGTLAVGDLNLDLKPAFNSRSIAWPWPAGSFDPTAWGLGGTGVFHSHIFSAIVPKDEKTFREHPDWFAMVNGKRQMSQLSFTSPEVVDRAAKYAHDFFKQKPEYMTFSLSPDDAGGFDESPAAQALDVNAGGRTLAFANAVSRKLRQTDPGKKVIFYAYWFTKPAPTRVKAEPGVEVMMIDDTCQAHALDDPSCPTNKEWRIAFDGWKRTGAGLSAYEWYVPAATDPRWQSIPFVPGDVALRDLRFYRSQGIRWMYYESFNHERADAYPLRWPLYYTVARGMENPNLTFAQIMAPACRSLFGPAAAPMTSFYAELARALEACPIHWGNWTPPNPKRIYTPEVQSKLRRLIAEAEAATQKPGTDPKVSTRVAEVRRAWEKATPIIAQFPD